MKDSIKEILDQATILCNAKTNEDIADYLAENNVIHFPVKVGDTVYFLSSRGAFGSLLTSGCVIKRKVDAVQYDGKIKIISHRPNPNDRDGNLYEYWNEMVFGTEEKAQAALDAIMERM